MSKQPMLIVPLTKAFSESARKAAIEARRKKAASKKGETSSELGESFKTAADHVHAVPKKHRGNTEILSHHKTKDEALSRAKEIGSHLENQGYKAAGEKRGYTRYTKGDSAYDVGYMGDNGSGHAVSVSHVGVKPR